MFEKIRCLSVIIVFCLMFSSSSDDGSNHKNMAESIHRIDISQQWALCAVLEDAIGEDLIDRDLNSVFYMVNLIDHKGGTMVNVSRLSNSFIQKASDCIGFTEYEGELIIVNGKSEYSKNLNVINDSIVIRTSNTEPTPDGIRNWTYHIQDSVFTRFFPGMGLMRLPDVGTTAESKNNRPIVTLPKRKTITPNP